MNNLPGEGNQERSCVKIIWGWRLMMHPGLAALNGRWDKAEYAASFRARFAAIPDSDQAHHCWRVGWEDADTELLESSRHSRAVAEGKEDDYLNTWGLLFDAGGDARGNGITLSPPPPRGLCCTTTGARDQRRNSRLLSSVMSQIFYYIVARVFGRWSLPSRSMRMGGCFGCSSR